MLKLLSFTTLFSLFFFTSGLYRSLPVNANIFYLIILIIQVTLLLMAGKISIKSINTINFIFLNFIFLLYMAVMYILNSLNNVYAFSLLIGHIYCFLFMILFSISFDSCASKDFYKKINNLIFFTILFCCLFNFYEAFIQGADIANTSVKGRADGFFKNPNQSAILLTFLSSLIIPKYNQIGFRLPLSAFLVIIFLGLLATFSKGSAVVYVVMLFYTLIRSKSFTVINTSIIILFLFIVVQSYQSIISYIEFTELIGSNSLNRLQLTEQYESLNSRYEVLPYTFQAFKDSPVFGNGLGYNYTWDLGYGSHNIFFAYLVDLGISGLLLLCLLLSRLFFIDNLLFFLTFIFVGVFSHNIMSQVEIYIIISTFFYLNDINNNNKVVS